SYETAIHGINPAISTYAIDCPLFVPLVENGMFHVQNQLTALTIKYYLQPLKQIGIDTLILGCTHYPLLMDSIADFMGSGVSLIHPGLETAIYIEDFTLTQNLQNNTSTKGSIRCFVSDNTEQFKKNMEQFIGFEPHISIEQIEIQDF
ncbi:MAG: glutamate racemase, partial [Oscillospiraceae bacterium]